MMLLAKAALGLGTTIVLAGAYTMREGVIRIDVDEYHAGGSHVHMWVPAAAVPMAMHFVPAEHMRHVSYQAREASFLSNCQGGVESQKFFSIFAKISRILQRQPAPADPLFAS